MNLNTFEEYTEAVILAYEKKKNEGKLPGYLQHHTPANLKKEFVNEFSGRFQDWDKKIFKLLLGTAENKEEYYQKIKALDSDDFKPLNNFLKGHIKSPKEVTIYLVAWLIDFKPRPFKPGMVYDPAIATTSASTPAVVPPRPEAIPAEIATVETDVAADSTIERRIMNTLVTADDKKEGTADTTPMQTVVNDRSKFKQIVDKLLDKRVVYFTSVVIMIGGLVYYYLTAPRYMYWNGNEYKAIGFFQKAEGADHVPLDTWRLANFKRIKDKSCITAREIRKVHYAKIYGMEQFFTAGGENPEDTSKRLLPMTEYIYKKYVLGLAVKP